MIRAIFIVRQGICVFSATYEIKLDASNDLLAGFLSALPAFAKEIDDSQELREFKISDYQFSFKLLKNSTESGNFIIVLADAKDKSEALNKILEMLAERFEENYDLDIEELEPFLEVAIRDIAQKHRITTPVLGSGLFPRHNEFSTGLVATCIASTLGKTPPAWIQKAQDIFASYKDKIPSRFPTFCPGCPERAMLMAIKQATGNLKKPKTIIAGDIGCYVMGIMPPLNVSDFIICMSGGLSAAIGLSKKTTDKIIALIGDSTFMHTGMPVLADAVANEANVLLVIFDNRWVAMTGHQPPVGKGLLSFESIVQALGVSWVKVVDPFKVDQTVKAIEDGLAKDGMRVLICQRECALMAKRAFDAERRKLKASGEPFSWDSYQIYNCVMCEHCVNVLSCPAMRRVTDEYGEEMMKIDEDRCVGCGVCHQICIGARIGKTVFNPHANRKIELRRLEE